MTFFNNDDLTPEALRNSRTSVKWSTAEPDVLPMFIAEMDFPVDKRIQDALVDQVLRSDLGYADDLSGLIGAFSAFSADRWGWHPDQSSFFSAPDVSFGVKAALRHHVPAGGRVALTTPVYPSFFQYLIELGFDCVEVPLVDRDGDLSVDTQELARLFAADGDEQVHAMILSNPHNPHGIAHSPQVLEELAIASHATGALIVSDEIHAPLVHDPATFTPFAPIAQHHKAVAVVVTSASKGWNIAGTKCALIYAPEAFAPASLREYLAISLGFSASILGRTASTVAFAECSDWLDKAIAQVRQNSLDLVDLLADHLPGARYTPPASSYLAWIDLREAGLGDNPAAKILADAKVMVSDGATFGENGAGFIRLNLGCSPEVLREGIERMGSARA